MTNPTESKKPAASEAAAESMLSLLTRLDKMRDEAIARRLSETKKHVPPWSPEVYVPAMERMRQRFDANARLIAGVTGVPVPELPDLFGPKVAGNAGGAPAPRAALERLVAEFCAPVVGLLRGRVQMRGSSGSRNSRGDAAVATGAATKPPLNFVCWEPASRLLYLEWERDIDTSTLAQGDRVDAVIETAAGRRSIRAGFERRHSGEPDPMFVKLELAEGDLSLAERGEIEVKWLHGDEQPGDRLEIVFRAEKGQP